MAEAEEEHTFVQVGMERKREMEVDLSTMPGIWDKLGVEVERGNHATGNGRSGRLASFPPGESEYDSTSYLLLPQLVPRSRGCHSFWAGYPARVPATATPDGPRIMPAQTRQQTIPFQKEIN